ncbi:PREDICTED: uncharacterized protein LOC104603777 isoform X2 [Nelumbo nucifera]|uniref:Uncharacterized protein LOC104603777 isoform X2 n=2 Tax=Nelumbo nucifera TaxID=4432 RepID=A0A1U8Q8K5_NELNU|nr:PREDICTED: uncharacterized protein LOC104603777 isoform X2 [Nelumbo nucifera]XP_019054376.1 PREDICTED: uncharacterized protein LOC104603777 isoform X2 [Nelumbo nucifera]XP_019054377.1 PREDICTED: uncharacterized protein LOC104603777 isoform X2 [Nelumbo nucifera]DAD41838.1 TPA_asm: hypothetical protein HUJ06_016161 [Nelumbo nucifera]
MADISFSNERYTYIHDIHKGSIQAIDNHHIVVRKSNARGFLLHICILTFLAIACYLFLLKEKSSIIYLSSILLGLTLVRLLHWKSVVKESVVIMPAFGVQLETHYGSGRVVRRFVPMGNILRPVLNECVTPVTCYWSLALIVRGEAELMLVFKELRPPVKMLVPIWKALCAAIDIKESTDEVAKDDH